MAEMVPLQDGDETKVEASPTKRFFVDIITRDILIGEAIQDLIDNCIDGAKRLRPSAGERYDGLEVSITATKEAFELSDNCGGIPLVVAQKYAFRFGRAEGFDETEGSVGQFGVGMKRALFKLGRHFSVLSRTIDSSFEISVDVDAWVKDDINWDFNLSNLNKTPIPLEETGTTLRVWDLDAGVVELFSKANFVSALKDEIRVRQQDAMSRGLRFNVNDEAIIPLDWELLSSGDALAPANMRYNENIGGTAPLTMRIYAGVGSSSPAHAGWYIFCNGRCILEADQSEVTGWAESSGGVAIPKYHGQFARFRGYAFLDSRDASLLPWNTTKTGIDLEADAYRRLKPKLIEATRPVIDFLNALDGENELDEKDRVLTEVVKKATYVSLESLPERIVFTSRPPGEKAPTLTRISYHKPKAQVEALAEVFGVRKPKEVGELAFDYAFSEQVGG
ncbi:ATP-binding protein [Brevundimonas sp.]|uniref:ATP-binding protein n=1 Tax=Brevundimonas sp. TaxID=1871086 RepID=UPI0028A0B9A2|nr:ATP-binding protein [Brevundimonas sp.]